MKKILVAGMMFFAVYRSGAQAIPALDSSYVKYFVQQLLDPEVSIGVFSTSGEQPEIHYMKSGLLPELHEQYVDIMMRNFLVKLKTEATIKGSFDNVVFVQGPKFQSEDNLPTQFMPYSGTKMILCLKKCLNENGTAAGWVKKVPNYNGISFINPQSAFQVVNQYYGTIYLQWNKQFETGPTFQYASDQLSTDLKEMQAVITVLPKDKSNSEYNTKVKSLLTIPKDAYGKAIAQILVERLK